MGNILRMKDYFILLLALAVACANASKCEKLPQMRPKGANLSAHMLGNIGQFLLPGDSVGKMTGTSKQWSKVNKLVYENVTPTKDPIAVFKKIEEEKFFLEDPKNLLDPAINGFNYCPPIDFSTATWEEVFEYSFRMRNFLRDDDFNRLFSKNATEFMKALAINAAQNCPFDFKSKWGRSTLRYAVRDNDVAVASVLLRRGAVIETDALAIAILGRNPEMVKILLENGADVH